jgi:hypothetical protein
VPPQTCKRLLLQNEIDLMPGVRALALNH